MALWQTGAQFGRDLFAALTEQNLSMWQQVGQSGPRSESVASPPARPAPAPVAVTEPALPWPWSGPFWIAPWLAQSPPEPQSSAGILRSHAERLSRTGAPSPMPFSLSVRSPWSAFVPLLEQVISQSSAAATRSGWGPMGGQAGLGSVWSSRPWSSGGDPFAYSTAMRSLMAPYQSHPWAAAWTGGWPMAMGANSGNPFESWTATLTQTYSRMLGEMWAPIVARAWLEAARDPGAAGIWLNCLGGMTGASGWAQQGATAWPGTWPALWGGPWGK